jgi:hypothetical protein
VKTQAAVETLAAAGVSNPVVATGNRHGAPVNTVAVVGDDHKMHYLAYDALPFNKSVPLAAATSTTSPAKGAAAIAAAAASLQGAADIGMYGHGVMPRGTGYYSGGMTTAAGTITGVKGAPSAYMVSQGLYDSYTGADAEMRDNAVAIGGGDALTDYVPKSVLAEETCPFGWQCDSRSGGCWKGVPGMPGTTFDITPIPCSTQADDVRTPVDPRTLANAAKVDASNAVHVAKGAAAAKKALAALAPAFAHSSQIPAYQSTSFHAHSQTASSAFDVPYGRTAPGRFGSGSAYSSSSF